MTVPSSLGLWPMKNRAPKNVPLPVRAARLLKRLRHVRGLDEGEKSLHALGLAASPEERWELWAKQMRSNGYWQSSHHSVPPPDSPPRAGNVG